MPAKDYLQCVPFRTAAPRSKCYTSTMEKFDQIYEQFKVHANELGGKVRELIHEGNVRRIIIKDERGHTFIEIPLTVATVGVVLAPVLAALAAIATLVSKFEVVVERTVPADTAAGQAPTSNATDPSVGATEDKVDMKDTVAQRVDSHGTKIEDVAGSGQHDSQGG
jgi:hypothetical protein